LSERAEIDKAAAGRFIKHAITQATSAKPPSEDSVPTLPESSSSSVRAPVKVTSKMLERQQYEKDLKEQDEAQSEEEEELALYGDDDMYVDPSVPTSPNKGKGKEVLSAVQEPIAESSHKRRRPAVDPFAGNYLITCLDITPICH
jgi:exosome complex protein LRP1